MKKLIAVALFLAACSDSNGPPGPNLIVDNESAGEAARLTLTDGATVILDTVIAVGGRLCVIVDARGLVAGEVAFAGDTFAVTPIWLAETNTYSDALFLRAGPTVIQTRGVRRC